MGTEMHTQFLAYAHMHRVSNANMNFWCDTPAL